MKGKAAGGQAAGLRRHVPQRTCIACREVESKRQLIRVVRSADGRVTVDLSGKQAGRGAYLCQRAECWQRALKRQALQRALRIESLDPHDLQALTLFGEQFVEEQPAI